MRPPSRGRRRGSPPRTPRRSGARPSPPRSGAGRSRACRARRWPGTVATSWRSAPVRSLYSATRPSSKERPVQPDLVEERPVEREDRARRRAGRGGDGHLAERVDRPRRVAAVRAALRARLAGEAEPDRLVRQETLALVEVHEAHDVVRAQRRLPGHGAAGGALAALVAAGGVPAGALLHLRAQGDPAVGAGVRTVGAHFRQSSGPPLRAGARKARPGIVVPRATGEK